MARIRGAATLWNAVTTVDVDTAPHATSAAAAIGAEPNVALFITANKVCTFKIQVATNLTPGAGNNLDNANWYDWHRSADADGVETITTAATGGMAVDLSPFAPQFVRLVATAVASGPATVSAYVTSSG